LKTCCKKVHFSLLQLMLLIGLHVNVILTVVMSLRGGESDETNPKTGFAVWGTALCAHAPSHSQSFTFI
jgi:hypothetical protein